jgi:hypothetical protein
MVHSRHMLTDFISKEDSVMNGDNTAIKSLGTGTFKGFHTNQHGDYIEITLTHVLLVPDLWVNLFSITKSTSQKGNRVICENNLIAVHTNTHEIHFDIILNHGNGKILAANFYQDTECANLTLKRAIYEDLHKKLGHPHKQAVFDTAFPP